MSGKKLARIKYSERRFYKLYCTRKKLESKYALQLFQAKQGYLKAKISGYPFFIVTFLGIFAISGILKSEIGFWISLCNFFVLGFLLKAHHMEVIGKDEQPRLWDYNVARQCMNLFFYIGVADGLVSLIAIICTIKRS